MCPAAQPRLESLHVAPVPFVIVAQQVQESMERQNAQLDAEGVTKRRGLAPGDASRDGDVT
jgi:hypothetical protein